METELARAVDVMMAQAKSMYILIIKVKKLFSFFSSRCFLKEMENMYSVFLSKTPNNCGNPRLRLVFLQHFSFSQTSIRVSQIDRNMVHVLYFLKKKQRREKGKQLVNCDYQNANFLCSRPHYVNSSC